MLGGEMRCRWCQGMTEHLIEKAFQVIWTYWKKCAGIASHMQIHSADPVILHPKHAKQTRQVQ